MWGTGRPVAFSTALRTCSTVRPSPAPKVELQAVALLPTDGRRRGCGLRPGPSRARSPQAGCRPEWDSHFFVLTEQLHRAAETDGSFQGVGDEVAFGIVFFADLAIGISAGGVEVAQGCELEAVGAGTCPRAWSPRISGCAAMTETGRLGRSSVSGRRSGSLHRSRRWTRRRTCRRLPPASCGRG